MVSESGMSNEAEVMLRHHVSERPRIIAIFGKDCRAIEDLCDQISDELEIFVVTTSHPDESLDDVISMIKTFDRDELGEKFETVKI